MNKIKNVLALNQPADQFKFQLRVSAFNSSFGV